MKGWKTFVVSMLLIVWACIGPFKLVNQDIWQSVALGLIALCFVTLRVGLRVSWSGAYKVYVDRTQQNKILETKGSPQ